MSHTIKVQESSKLLRHNCEEFFSPLCKSLYFGCEWLICIITVQLFFHSWTLYKCHSNLIGSYTFNTYLSLMCRIFNLFTRRWKKAPSLLLHFCILNIVSPMIEKRGQTEQIKQHLLFWKQNSLKDFMRYISSFLLPSQWSYIWVLVYRLGKYLPYIYSKCVVARLW